MVFQLCLPPYSVTGLGFPDPSSLLPSTNVGNVSNMHHKQPLGNKVKKREIKVYYGHACSSGSNIQVTFYRSGDKSPHYTDK